MVWCFQVEDNNRLSGLRGGYMVVFTLRKITEPYI